MISKELALAAVISLGLHSALFFPVFFLADDFSGKAADSSTLLIHLAGSISTEGSDTQSGGSLTRPDPALPNPNPESETPPSIPSSVLVNSDLLVSLAQNVPSAMPFVPTETTASAALSWQANSPFLASPLDALPASEPVFQSAAPHSVPKPDYPLPARRRGIEGVVRIELEIDAGGSLSNLSITPPRGDPLLEESVLASLENISFTPAMRDDRPVRSTLSLKFRFELED